MSSLLTAGRIVCDHIQYEAALQLSDPRLKRDTVLLSDCTADLMQVSPVEFNWKHSGRRAVGFLADEIQRYVPACVREDDKGVKMIDESALVAVVFQALKKNYHKVAELDSQVQRMRIMIAGLSFAILFGVLWYVAVAAPTAAAASHGGL